MIYVIYKDEQTSYVCDAHSNSMFSAFERHGCKLLSEREFCTHRIPFSNDDKIIVCVSFKTQEAYTKFAELRCEKWLYSIDESKSDGELFRTQIDFFNRTGTQKIINTYPSERNVQFLQQHGATIITLPICGTQRQIDCDKKDIDIIVSGQMDDVYYPVRSKLSRILRSRVKEISGNVFFLDHAGFSTSATRHEYHGKKFLSLLDRCWLGVTCRAGWRDRMVAKYIEFGFSHVLPIGDVPSYMPIEMKTSMLSINESDTDDMIIKSINMLLNNRQTLVDRIKTYASVVIDQHDLDKNIARIIHMIESGESEK